MSVPQLGSLEAKWKMVAKVNAAIADACQGITSTKEIMVFLDEYPLENVGWAGRLQSDRPEVVAALGPLMSVA